MVLKLIVNLFKNVGKDTAEGEESSLEEETDTEKGN